MNDSPSQTCRHSGPPQGSANGFDIVDCQTCGFRHVLPMPTAEQLVEAYRHEYYSADKPLYIQRYLEDIEWWNMVYSERYDTLEAHLPAQRRRLLDVGSGPGLFLEHGRQRGWQVQGIEPSVQAAEHSRSRGLQVANVFLSAENAVEFGRFDAINLSEVLEHIPDAPAFLDVIYGMLEPGGLVVIAVPNDFNPLQKAAVATQPLKDWWLAPPHHVNYFDQQSLPALLKRRGFEVVHQEGTFPIELFLLMGDLYVGDDALGRACHGRRKQFELNLKRAGLAGLKRNLYQKLAELGIGREVVVVARRPLEQPHFPATDH